MIWLTCKSGTLYTLGTAILPAEWAWHQSPDRQHDNVSHNPYKTASLWAPPPSHTLHTKTPHLLWKNVYNIYISIIRGSEVKQIYSLCFLEINITKNLSWSSHIWCKIMYYFFIKLEKVKVIRLSLVNFYRDMRESIITWNTTNCHRKALNPGHHWDPSTQNQYYGWGVPAQSPKDATRQHPAKPVCSPHCRLAERYKNIHHRTTSLESIFFPQAVRLLNSFIARHHE